MKNTTQLLATLCLFITGLIMGVTAKKPKFGFGKYKVEISEDFDSPLEDFKDYM